MMPIPRAEVLPPRLPGRALFLILLALTLLYCMATRAGLMFVAEARSDASLATGADIFATGLLYDLAFFCYAMVPASLCLLLAPRLWRTRTNRVLIHALVFAWIYLLGFIAEAEFVFWDEFEVRFNFIAVDYLVYTSEVVNNIWESYRVVWLLLANLGFAGIVYWVVAPLITRTLNAQDAWAPRLRQAALLWTCALVAYVCVDQQPRERFRNDYAAELASNGPYQFVAAFRNNELDYERFYATMPVARVDRILRAQLSEPNAKFLSDAPLDVRRYVDNPGQPRRLNIVLIMVESLSSEFMGHFGDSRGFTPHLDALARDSLVFENFYATGTRTDRGLEAVTLSLPPTPGRSIVKRRGHDTGLWSLGNVLREQGYAPYFVYGGRGYFDNMNAFFAGNGYAVIDQTSTPDAEIRFANAWGMSDEDLYRQAMKVADREYAAGTPFFMHIMTTSNHRPYTYPAGSVDTPAGGRGGAIKYTDWAIHDFIEAARRQPWFDDTVFVILGDHCANSAGKVDLPASRYHIPLLLFSPKHVAADAVRTLASQIDVAPTLLALLHLDYESMFFGRDLLTAGPAGERALIGTYQHLGLIQDQQVTILSPRQVLSRHAVAADAFEARAPRADDPLVEHAIALYQGASYVYSHRLNAWGARTAPAGSRLSSTPP